MKVLEKDWGKRVRCLNMYEERAKLVQLKAFHYKIRLIVFNVLSIDFDNDAHYRKYQK